MLADYFDLEWERCLDGYQIEERAEEKGKSLLTSRPYGTFIVARSERFETYEPFKVDGLWRRLAETKKTPEGICEFVTAFGMLSRDQEEEMAMLLYPYVDTMRDAVGLIDAGEWARLAKWMSEATSKGGPFGGFGRLSTVMLYRPGAERPEIKLRPFTLMSAIWLQFATDISENAKLRKCEWCGIWFRYGAGTKRRKTAYYCSQRCQKAHYRQRKEAQQ